MKKPLSLQWQLTIMTALLVTIVCLTLSYFISGFAVLYMDEIENSFVTILPKEALSKGNSENTDFYLEITGDLSGQVQNTQKEFWEKSLLITVLTSLISSSLTYFIVGYALRPLQQLGQQVEKVQAKNLQQPVLISNAPMEITCLTSAFNGMLQRLNDAFFSQRQFSANAAHELRTPLAIIQANLEVFKKQELPSEEDYKETMHMIQTQTERLSHVIDVLLEMTELQSSKKTDSISLAELTEEVLCDLDPLGKKKEITLIQKTGDIRITGNDTLIYRAIYNLVENAIKYNIPGGHVTVEMKKENAFAKVIVSDTGRGIDAVYSEKIFVPFFRIDKSRSRAMGGAGLGLALVKEIAHQHGGDVCLLQNSEKGTQIELRLPVGDPF